MCKYCSRITEKDFFEQLALKWGNGNLWGCTPEGAVKIIREIFSSEEVQALTAIPVHEVPLEPVGLDEIAANSDLPRDTLEEILDGLVSRSLIFTAKTQAGNKSYILPKQGHGYDQLFFWKGDKNERALKISQLQADQQMFQGPKMKFYSPPTKLFRYIPVTESIDGHWQNVYPTETIIKVLQKATRFAVAHCICREKHELKNGKSCGHSHEVCVKINDLAECVINAGLAREITREEAEEIMWKAEAEGLVHMADNAGEQIKHICNCCGCACWNVGRFRRRELPRDMLIATYFIRETNTEECIGCENCVEICPVDAVRMEDGVAKVDLEWCIGCGVCVPKCDIQAIKLVEKEPKPSGAESFAELHHKIAAQRAHAAADKSQYPEKELINNSQQKKESSNWS